MINRFIYPIINYGHKELQICSECDDGYAWFGIKEAIENYCKENGLEISNVNWRIEVNPNHLVDYVTIHAKNLEDWMKQFEELNVKWKTI